MATFKYLTGAETKALTHSQLLDWITNQQARYEAKPARRRPMKPPWMS